MPPKPKKKPKGGTRKRAVGVPRSRRSTLRTIAELFAPSDFPDDFIPNPDGPFVEFAGMCVAVEEDVEHDGTAIRGISEGTRLYLAPTRDERKGDNVDAGRKLYLRLRGGSRGKHELIVYPQDPLGRPFNVVRSIEEFPGDPQGISEIMLSIRFPGSPPGLFRIDVFIDEVFLTRVLFRLEFSAGLIPGRPPP